MKKNMKITIIYHNMQNNHTIITIIYVTNSIDEMMLFDGEQHLERLLQKSLRYQNQQKKL